MRFSDLSLLGKKVVVGLVITLVPLTLLLGALQLSQTALATRAKSVRAGQSK